MQNSLGVTKNQIPFAVARAINDTAKDAQKFEVETQLPGKLTLRSRGAPWQKPGSKFGINIKPFATKASLKAIVGSQADWLKLQEKGGTKSPTSHRLAIEAGARPGKTAVIPARLKPRVLLRTKGKQYQTRGGRMATARSSGAGFIIRTRSGPAIYTRLNKTQIKLMYFLETSARVPAILDFFESGARVVQERFPIHFQKHFIAALATAKKK